MNPISMAVVLAFCMASSISGAALAQDVGEAGDHPLVGRYAGSVISFHETRAYDEVALPDRIVPAGEDRNPGAWTSKY